MKLYFVKIGLLVLVMGMFLSCGSAPDPANPTRPLSGFPNATVIGNVRATFESIDVYFHGSQRSLFREVDGAAHRALLEIAMQEYTGMIDIADIVWVYSQRSGGSALNMRATYTATGKVVSLDGSSGRASATGVEGALERAAEEVSEAFSARTRLAIVYITAQDRSTTEFITGELEHILRRRGFIIIDRSELDRIRAEQQYGLSGEVDDSTAARIGNIAGASVVITGRVDGEGDLRRLRLRALDTSNGQVVGTASERL